MGRGESLADDCHDQTAGRVREPPELENMLLRDLGGDVLGGSPHQHRAVLRDPVVDEPIANGPCISVPTQAAKPDAAVRDCGLHPGSWNQGALAIEGDPHVGAG